MLNKIIENRVKPFSRVIDIGCGNGDLLKTLKKNKSIKAYAIEPNNTHSPELLQKGISFITGDCEDILPELESDSFDVAIFNMSLQVTFDTKQNLLQALRIAKEVIVVFPNFGLFRNRFSFFFKGQMPQNKFISYSWHNTPNIHFCTITDFTNLCTQEEINIINSYSVTSKNKIVNINKACYIKRYILNFVGYKGLFVLSKPNL